MKKTKYIQLPILLVLVLLLTAPAFAHKVIVFAWAEKGHVFVEGGFGGKRPAKHCIIKALDDKNQVIYQGETDDQGNHRFELPKGSYTSLTLVLEAGPGHHGTWTIDNKEIEQARENQAASLEEKTPPDALTHGPSPLKIGGGIAVIFVLAWLGRRFARKKDTA